MKISNTRGSSQLEKSKNDFAKLIERIESQQSFLEGKSKGVSWEVRKTTCSKLNALALPFQPLEEEGSEEVVLDMSATPSDPASLKEVTVDPAPRPEDIPVSILQPDSSVISIATLAAVPTTINPIQQRSFKTVAISSTAGNSLTSRKSASGSAPVLAKEKPAKVKKSRTASGSSGGPSKVLIDVLQQQECDEEDSEVVRASESVWAHAEALVEAELAAEELAWESMLSESDPPMAINTR